MRILIADDETFVVEGLTRLLSQNIAQVEVISADNGRSALELVREEANAPDLLITDVNMPLMDGIELSQRIRERYPRCRIMIISGYEDFQAARSAIELGALRYMLKPVNHAEMVAYVRSVLEDVQREQDERIRHTTDRLESLLVDLHNHMLLDAPYRGAERIAAETGDYCALRLAVVGAPGGDGAPSLRPAIEQALVSRAAPSYLIRAEGAQATLLLCDFSDADARWLERLAGELASALAHPVAVGVGRRCETLAQVADTLNMSPSYISMIFKEKTGQNFKDYLFQTRMSHAKRLLRQGMPIGEIARQLGYEDTEHFSRRFRARFGVSPMAYRRETGGAGAEVRVRDDWEKT